MERYDLVIAGGGLAGSLLAVAVHQRVPHARVLLIEQGDQLGGNHRWSWFDSDLSTAGQKLLADLDHAHWSGYEVRFPAYFRRLSTGYNSFESAALDAWVRAQLPSELVRTGVAVAAVSKEHVVLASQERIAADLVLDARGPGATDGFQMGWQKFIGHEYDIPGHGVTVPIIMDANVDQSDGYRFVYTLPLSPSRLFIEDTYYSLTPDLDHKAIPAAIGAMAAGYGTAQLMAKEVGVLPIIFDGDPAKFWPADDDVQRIGMASGLFHQLTGYSLPWCVNTALALADKVARKEAIDPNWSRNQLMGHWRNSGFYRMLGKMLFGAAAPAQRYKVFEHFYRLPQNRIERFYAGKSTLTDKARVLIGKPPVPIHKAVSVLLKKGQF